MRKIFKTLANSLVLMNLGPVLLMNIIFGLALLVSYFQLISNVLVLLELLYIFIYLPIFLFVENYRFNLMRNNYNFCKNILFICLSTLLADIIFLIKFTVISKEAILEGVTLIISLAVIKLVVVLIVGFVIHKILEQKSKKLIGLHE